MRIKSVQIDGFKSFRKFDLDLKPLNVLIGPKSGPVPVAELAALGVRRISLGSSLANAANGALVRAAHELLDNGTLGFTKDGVGGAPLMAIMNGESPVSS